MSCCRGAQEEDQSKATSKAIDNLIKKDKILYKSVHKLLLFGGKGAGKTTVVKQMKILHRDGYTNTERLEKLMDILNTVREIILSVLTALPKLDPPVEIAEEENMEKAEYLLDVLSEPGFSMFTPELFEIVEKVWQDDGVKSCYSRSNEYQLIDSAEYFMDSDKLKEISQPGFKPSDQDILRCYENIYAIEQTKFIVDKVHFQIFDVGGQSTERRKWIQYFNDVTAILFVVPCSSFDTVIDRRNQLEESMNLFESVWNNRWLRSVSIILFLNKQDELKRKIEGSKVKLEDYFPDFDYYVPPIYIPQYPRLKRSIFRDLANIPRSKSVGDLSEVDNKSVEDLPNIPRSKSAGDLAKIDFYSWPRKPGVLALVHRWTGTTPFTRAKNFIRDQFIRIARKNHDSRHFCYPHFTIAIDTENIRRVFDSCRDIVQRMHLVKYELL